MKWIGQQGYMYWKVQAVDIFTTLGLYGLWGAIRNVNRVVLVACCYVVS